MIVQAFTNNYIMVFELIGLSILLRMSSHVPLRVKRLTVGVIVLLLTEAVAFELEQWTQSFETLSLLRPMLTAYKYSVFPFILLLLTQVTAAQDAPPARVALVLAPAVLAIPLYFTSQWTGIVFFYAEGNSYHGGLIPKLPYLIFGGYLAVFLIRNFRYFRLYSQTNRVAFFYITLGAVAGTGIYLLVLNNENFGGLFTAAIVLYYLLIYIHLAQIDPLTKLLNRQSYYQDLIRMSSRITGVVSVDMNDLKVINDTQGHEAGDLALKTVASGLQAGCGSGGVPYRVGGDEFIILYVNTDGVLIEQAVANMRTAIGQSPYTCAFGSAICPRGSSLRECIRESDRRMYVDKARIKASRKTTSRDGSQPSPEGDLAQ